MVNQIIISKKELEDNIHLIQNMAKRSTSHPKIIAVLKGNAYGLGLIEFASLLLENHITFFATADLSEAVSLREHGFTNDILVLNATSIPQELEVIVQQDCIATIDSLESLQQLNTIASRYNKKVRCHLKIDTGFGRFGFLYSQILHDPHFVSQLAATLQACEHVTIEGTYSHFQESYAADSKRTTQQFQLFQDCVNQLKEAHIPTGLLHICNSMAFLKYEQMHLDAVRIGSAFTGRLPVPQAIGLKRIGYLESTVCAIKNLEKGMKIGYSGTYPLKKASTIAVVEAGYFHAVSVTRDDYQNDFLSHLRNIKNDLVAFWKEKKLEVEINQQKYRVVGRVCMNNLLIDVSHSDVKIGDKVKLEIPLMYADSSMVRQYIS